VGDVSASSFSLVNYIQMLPEHGDETWIKATISDMPAKTIPVLKRGRPRHPRHHAAAWSSQTATTCMPVSSRASRRAARSRFRCSMRTSRTSLTGSPTITAAPTAMRRCSSTVMGTNGL
jgi:hypothetical protein